jgi:hypothetical protein
VVVERRGSDSRSQVIEQRSIIMEAGKLEWICTMIALTYDCYYTTDMTLAGAGKRAPRAGRPV